MIEQIRQLVTDDEMLGGYEASLRDILQGAMAGDDRLRHFLQLVILSRLCVEELDDLDKTGILSELQAEADRKKEQVREMIFSQSSELRKKYEDIVARQNAAMAEIRAHYEVLSSIAEAVGPWDTDGAMASRSTSVQTLLGELEAGLKTLVEIRKSEDFDRLCRMEAETAR